MLRGAIRLAMLIPVTAFCQAEQNSRWDFLRANLDVFPGMDQFFEPDPKLFWRLRGNLQHVKAAERLPGREYPFTASTDSAGCRLQPRVNNARASILFLGDSCTFGIPVNDREAFPAVVQEKLDGVQCINAGVPGYSAFQGRLRLEDFSAPADVAVIAFWPNDRSTWDQLSDLEHRQLSAAQRGGEFSRYQVLRLLRRLGPERPRLDQTEFAEQIRGMVGICRARSIVPVLLIWPARAQMDQELAVGHQDVLRRIAREENVSSLDLVPVFRSRDYRALFADSVHATRRGYRLVAETLAPLLQRLLEAPR
jgi:lysophospholipase L1-like esterase